MKIYAKDYGILPECDCTDLLSNFFCELAKIDGEKTVLFENGTYYLNRSKCRRIYRAITNTTSAKEYKNLTDVNMHYVPFIFENIKNLVLDGNGSTFVIDGKVTNAVISDCENITIKNLAIKTISPNVHKLTVLSKTAFSVTFSLCSESKYSKEDDGYYFNGNGYRLGFFENKEKAFWTSTVKPNNKNKISRTSHPFKFANKIEKISPYKFKAQYPFYRNFDIGQTFYIFDAHRSDVGIFIEKSKNIILDNVTQNFNYSLAYVAQDCVNLTIENCAFAPEKDSALELASLADFMQICMCSGKVIIRNNVFDGASDDALNVHGIHFGIDKIDGNKLTVSFRHPQSWGFNPLHDGDRIEFINPKTLLSVDKNKIISSKMTDNYRIELELESSVPNNYLQYVIEDTDRCPELLFENNTLNRIITRAILYTSRGKCVIRNNHFISNTMSGVLLSDDAKSWYESGMCRDVTIEDNIFDYCAQTPILIKPENRVHNGAVHKNITIKNNTFKKYKGYCIKAKSTDKITIENNSFNSNKHIHTKGCNHIKEI